MAIRIYCRHTSRYWMQEAEWQANKNQALDVHSTFPSFAFSVSPTVKAAALKRSYVCIQTKIKNIVSDIFSPKIDYRYISVKIIWHFRLSAKKCLLKPAPQIDLNLP